jgi:hypothetical protein
MGHAPYKIPQITTSFKVIVPLLATSHGGGALVALVVMGAEVPGSNLWASPPWRDLLYVCFTIWLRQQKKTIGLWGL